MNNPRTISAQKIQGSHALLFDLDDTLFAQNQYLAGAFSAVADVAHSLTGVDAQLMLRELSHIASAGSDQGRIIDQALDRLGISCDPQPLVSAFKEFKPRHLDLFENIETALAKAKHAGFKLGLVTDGDPQIQRAKIDALGIGPALDAIVISDEHGGRSFRKPNPGPILLAMKALGAQPDDTILIGDRPDKDGQAARRAGIRTIRVTTGEYSGMENEGHEVAVFSTLAEAVDFALDLVEYP